MAKLDSRRWGEADSDADSLMMLISLMMLKLIQTADVDVIQTMIDAVLIHSMILILTQIVILRNRCEADSDAGKCSMM